MVQPPHECVVSFGLHTPDGSPHLPYDPLLVCCLPELQSLPKTLHQQLKVLTLVDLFCQYPYPACRFQAIVDAEKLKEDKNGGPRVGDREGDGGGKEGDDQQADGADGGDAEEEGQQGGEQKDKADEAKGGEEKK